MAVCNGLLFYTLKQLFDVSVRLKDKQSSETISRELGKNPWLVDNILRPQVTSLGLEKIILLMRSYMNVKTPFSGDLVILGSSLKRRW